MALGLLAADGGSGSMPFLIVGVWVQLLAVFLGFELIQKVPPTLHTPLMSGSNAISGITIVGSLMSLGSGYPLPGVILGAIAVVLAMINVVGGFMVTNRMLVMFKPRKEVQK
jgi:NAD(P) transhydrogenase subunit alpha